MYDSTDFLPRGCRIIEFPEAVDSRGALSFAQGQEHIPFNIERVFWIYGVPQGQSRGAHSHCESAEVVIPVSGGFDMFVSDGTYQATVRMDSPRKGILIPPGVWCELRNFTPGTVCVVCASHPYNEKGYTNNYQEFLNEQVSVVPYTDSRKDEWNSMVANSRNGTFLLDRNYMDYHSDRFTDCSLMFYLNDKLIALLPADWKEEEKTVRSHGGLTYGGIIMSDKVTAVVALQVLGCAIDYLKRHLGAKRLLYKPIPYIYHRYPSQEDLYALSRCGAKLYARGVSSVIDLSEPMPMRQLRRRGVSRANRNGLVVRTGTSGTDIASFWNILTDVLSGRHSTRPVHSPDEMELLMNRFPDNIRLHLVEAEGRVIAGCVVYNTGLVAHVQYISASDEGKRYGALDLLFKQLIENDYRECRYFDFGISTENNGSTLNEGLVFQKEGFGGRTVTYDAYMADL